MKALFVHGALVGDGQWWWHRMVAPLARRGLATGAVVLPSCAEVPGELGDMYADAAAVSEAVGAAGEPVILCGHSYGGTVITEAGAGEPNVRHLIYITSVLPDLGQSLADAVGAGPAPWVHLQSDGTAVLRSERLQELFFQDCDDGTVAEALSRATPQSLAAFGQPVRRVAWREVPSTFVVCTEDRAIPVAGQRAQAAKVTRTIEIACGHHPFLSQPEALAQIIADSAR
ncbi:MAG: alpha/beta hydrolase [Pseudonocardiales bacterium]|nr:MAG: alpha/beta hydrolase [Pseudonocardiales bacterium]